MLSLYNRSKPFVIALILCMFVVALVPRPTTARFVIASWDYPDEYGQGIDNIVLYQYLSGSWVKHPLTTFGYGPNGNDTFEIQQGGALTVKVDCWLNGTLTGVGSLAAGLNYIRHSVVVSSPYNDSIFSKQNFTYISGSDSLAPMYFYIYNVTLDFSPDYSTVYTATIIYEVFW